MYWKVKVPRVAVNEDFVELIEWHVIDGAHVEAGTPLCVVETSKASFEIPNERSGFVKILAVPGQRVPVQGAVCLMFDSLDELQGHVSKREPVANGEKGFEATRKAAELAKSLGVDLVQIGKRGVIREKHVLEFHVARQAEPAASAKVTVQPADLCPTGENTARDASAKRIAAKVLRPILQPPLHAAMWVLSRVPIVSSLVETLVRAYPVGMVGSALRCAYYRNRLMHMGKRVIIRPGALFVTPGVIEIGDNCHIDYDAKIVGGTPERPIRIGKGVHIGPGTIIYGTGGVTIGDYAAVAAGSLVYTARTLPEHPARPGELISMSHSAPPDNKYVIRDSVVIQDYAFIGLNVSILPGVTVGRGAIVNSGAVIANDVPAYAIVGGPKSSVVGQRQLKDIE